MSDLTPVKNVISATRRSQEKSFENWGFSAEIGTETGWQKPDNLP
jgi:hypothetical protein